MTVGHEVSVSKSRDAVLKRLGYKKIWESLDLGIVSNKKLKN